MILAIQTDPISLLKPESDSSLLIAAEFERRGYSVVHFQPNQLLCRDNALFAKARRISLTDYRNTDIKTLEEFDKFALSDANICLIRQDPPFDDAYLTNTYLLESLCPDTYFVNPPSAIRNTPEKLSTLYFPQHIPSTAIVQDEHDLVGFIKQYGKAVVKSLYGFGGSEVVLVDKYTIQTAFNFLLKHKQVIVQEYLPSVVHGDKRVLVVCGQVVGFFRRVPQKGSILANLAQGGTAEICDLNAHELQIIRDVSAFLIKQGIAIAGIDLIDEKLIEINVTSPTGFAAYNYLHNVKCEEKVVDLLLS